MHKINQPKTKLCIKIINQANKPKFLLNLYKLIVVDQEQQLPGHAVLHLHHGAPPLRPVPHDPQHQGQPDPWQPLPGEATRSLAISPRWGYQFLGNLSQVRQSDPWQPSPRWGNQFLGNISLVRQPVPWQPLPGEALTKQSSNQPQKMDFLNRERCRCRTSDFFSMKFFHIPPTIVTSSLLFRKNLRLLCGCWRTPSSPPTSRSTSSAERRRSPKCAPVSPGRLVDGVVYILAVYVYTPFVIYYWKETFKKITNPTSFEANFFTGPC